MTILKNLPSSAMALVGWMIKDIFHVLGKRAATLMVVTVIAAFLDALTVALLLPLFGALGFANAASGGVLTHALVGVLQAIGVPYSPTIVGTIILIALILSAGMFLVQAYYSTQLQTKYVAFWQRRVFEGLTEARWAYLSRLRDGDVASTLTTEAMRLERSFYLLYLAFSSISAILLQILVAFAIAPGVTLIILIFSLSLFLVTLPLLRRAITVGTQLTSAFATFHARANELASAMKLIKATASERAANRVLDGAVSQVERLSLIQLFDVQIARATFEYASAASIALLLITGPLLLNLEISAIIVIVAMFVRLFPRITGLRQSLQGIVGALPGFLRIREVYQQAVDSREQSDRPRKSASGPASIRFNAVSVCGDNGKNVLDSINLEIPAGSFTAIVGGSGAGKTTLIDCVLGLAEPVSGEVIVDGFPLREVSSSGWRSGIGYLGQDPVLFAGTVRENVTWGSTEIDDAAVRGALVAAGAEFVFQLPQGIETFIEGKGGRFSGGERQRIALARAFCRTTRLLILDEATSALDSETEAAIVSAINHLKGVVTVIAASHRLSAIRDADEIIVLESSRIVERGRHSDLLALGGSFHALWNSQPATENEKNEIRSGIR